MEEDISIINTNTRNEKIKNFFINNKNKIILISSAITLVVIGLFGYQEYEAKVKIQLSNEFNLAVIEYSKENKQEAANKLLNIVNKADETYSILSLNFIIDNRLIEDQNKINSLFNILIEKTSLEKEIKNLIIYKKALYNADSIEENNLLYILNPLINSESIWKSHALYLVAEFFYNKNEMQKSKEFFSQIVILDNANIDIKQKAQKRLNRKFSE